MTLVMQTPCCPQTHDPLQWLSPAIAFLAVFVGPLLTWKMTKRQLEQASELEERKRTDALYAEIERRKIEHQLANKQIVAPMRQAWINKLRDDIAAFFPAAFRVTSQAHPDRFGAHMAEMLRLYARIELSLNLGEEDHRHLFELLSMLTQYALQKPGGVDPSSWDTFWKSQREIRRAAASVLKREWDRVKTEDAN